jgi:hypothetical protein
VTCPDISSVTKPRRLLPLVPDPLGAALLRYSDRAEPAGEDPLDLADPHLEKRIEAAARLARHEERVRVAAAKALRAWTEMVSAAVLGEGVTAAAGDPPPEGGEAPVPPGEVAPAMLAMPDPGAVTALSAQWSSLVTDMVEAELTAMLGEVFAGVLGEENTVSALPWQQQYIGEVHNRLTGVADQTFDLVRDAVSEGMGAGDSIPTIRDRVRDALAFRGESTWAGRAETIARTETIAAYNGGHLASWKVRSELAGTTTEKVWLATIDRRTRRTHYKADGQRVALDAKFTVGNAQMDHPGDPNGPADEVVSCRCTMLEVDADEETPDTAERQLKPAGEIDDEIARRREEDGDVRAFDDPDAVAGQRAPIPQQGPPPAGAQTASADAPTDGPAGVTAAATQEGSAMFPVKKGRPAKARPASLTAAASGVQRWVSDPYLAPFGEPTGDGRIFKVGSLRARELPLPLLFQESSGWGHEGSCVVGRITAAEFPEAGVTASGDYLADESVAEAVEKAKTMTEQGLGHVSVDLASVVAELVDENGDPVSMEDLFDAWDRGEDMVVLEQVVEGELIAVTQVATPAFANAKIRLVAALMDSEGTDIGVGDTVDVTTEDAGVVRGRVTAVDETNETVSVQPVDDTGADSGDLLTVAPAAVKVVVDTDEPTETAPTASVRRRGVFVNDSGGETVGVGDIVTVDPDAAANAGDNPDVDAWDGQVTAIDTSGATITVQPVDANGQATADPAVEQIDPAKVTLKTEQEGSTGGVTDSAGTDVAVGDTVSADIPGDQLGGGRAEDPVTVTGDVTAVDPMDGTVTFAPATASDGQPVDGTPLTVDAASVTVTAEWEDQPGADLGYPPGTTAASLARKTPGLVASALVASASGGPLRPARAWFEKQPLTRPTALTATDEGQLYGHVAQWGQCHVGFTNTCWTAPESPSDYAYFHVGEVVCDDGSHVSVGNLTLGPRHADVRLAYREAVEHYDQAGCGVGVVRCYEDEYGIQFAGALTPGVTEEQLYDMRRCPVSGDWRKIGGELDLIGVLSVNSGGYPTPRFATDEYGRTALVAAPGVRPEPPDGDRRPRRGMSQRQVMARIKEQVRAEIRADEQRRRRLDRMAATIKRDPRSRLEKLAERMAR